MGQPLRAGDLAGTGAVLPGAGRVWVGGSTWARAGDLVAPHAHGPAPVSAPVLALPDAAHRVWIGGRPAALVGDRAACGCGSVPSPALGLPRVIVSGGSS